MRTTSASTACQNPKVLRRSASPEAASGRCVAPLWRRHHKATPTSCLSVERNNVTQTLLSRLIFFLSGFLLISRAPLPRSPGATTPRTTATASPRSAKQSLASPWTLSATSRTIRAVPQPGLPTSTPCASRCFTAAPPCCVSRWVRKSLFHGPTSPIKKHSQWRY